MYYSILLSITSNHKSKVSIFNLSAAVFSSVFFQLFSVFGYLNRLAFEEITLLNIAFIGYIPVVALIVGSNTSRVSQ